MALVESWATYKLGKMRNFRNQGAAGKVGSSAPSMVEGIVSEVMSVNPLACCMVMSVQYSWTFERFKEKTQEIPDVLNVGPNIGHAKEDTCVDQIQPACYLLTVDENSR